MWAKIGKEMNCIGKIRKVAKRKIINYGMIQQNKNYSKHLEVSPKDIPDRENWLTYRQIQSLDHIPWRFAKEQEKSHKNKLNWRDKLPHKLLKIIQLKNKRKKPLDKLKKLKLFQINLNNLLHLTIKSLRQSLFTINQLNANINTDILSKTK